MKIDRSTRVCRLTVLAVTLVALASRIANAEPLLAGSSGSLCTGVVAESSLDNCGLFDLGAPSATQSLTGSLQADNDVALFQFILTAAAGVSAFTSGYEVTGFDSLIGLFNGDGSIVQYFNTEQGDDVDAENDDIDFDNFNSALPVIVLDPGTYFLALLQTGNNFNSGLDSDSLLEGFSADDDPNYRGGVCSEGCAFSLSLNVDSGGEPPVGVPEPGTLSLVILGSAAALARRLRPRARQH